MIRFPNVFPSVGIRAHPRICLIVTEYLHIMPDGGKIRLRGIIARLFGLRDGLLFFLWQPQIHAVLLFPPKL